MRPYISIIIPAYNCEQFIGETIQSVCAQTYECFEVIVIDDCSKDHTINILNDLKEKDERIKIYKNDRNYGSAITRNKGIALANYEWIAFIDADDCWDPQKLEKQVNLIKQKNDVKFVFSGSAFMDSLGNRMEYVYHVPEVADFETVMGQNVISCSSVLIKKQLLIDHRMPSDKKIHEDYATWLMILETGVVAYGVDEPLLIYRVHAKSKSANKVKAAMMHWNCYSYVKCSFIRKVRGMFMYLYRSVRKFSKIR